jgi:predicted HTH transcriptional regulator
VSSSSTQEPETTERSTGAWAFLTNHAHVLVCIARDPQSRARDIAEQIGITERATQRILADLIADGYVKRTKMGRRNHYTIDVGRHLRHALFRELSVGPLLEVLSRDGQPKSRPTQRSRRRP